MRCGHGVQDVQGYFVVHPLAVRWHHQPQQRVRHGAGHRQVDEAQLWRATGGELDAAQFVRRLVLWFVNLGMEGGQGSRNVPPLRTNVNLHVPVSSPRVFLNPVVAPRDQHDVFQRAFGTESTDAIAGGMELVQGTDIRVSVPGAKFGLQEVKHALFPAGGSTVRMPRQMPYAKAMELMLTGDLISADEALARGFLNYVVEPGELMGKAMEIAAKLAANGPIAVQAIRQSARAVWGHPEADAMRMESEFSRPVFQSEDAVEGPKAFMEKRAPVYKGR